MKIYRLVFNPIEVNTYILADESNECAIIDCGCYNRSEFNELTDLLDKNSLKPVLLLNTHCHLDHIFGDGLMLEKYGIGAMCSKEDIFNRKSAVSHAMMFGLSMEPPPDPAGYITDNMKLSFGNTELTAINVPGHSPGCLAFYSEKDQVVFTGDALFAGSIGRTDLPGGNYELIINSIESRLFILPAGTVVYPGHGDATDIGTEKFSNPFFKHI